MQKLFRFEFVDGSPGDLDILINASHHHDSNHSNNQAFQIHLFFKKVKAFTRVHANIKDNQLVRKLNDASEIAEDIVKYVHERMSY